MKEINMKAVLAAAGIAALAVAGAPTAQAQPNTYAETYIYWTGAPCIDVASAQQYNPQYSTVNSICGGEWSFSEGNIWPGDLFGADPIIGSANYVECAVYRGGVLVWQDSGTKGDGNDINCLRRAV